jgi:hypothetical protein
VDDPAARPRLAGSLAGGIEDLVAVHDAIALDLHAYAWFLLAPGRHAADAGPAEAVLDALLVAGETAEELVDPGLTRAWLYALTRNECLRRAGRSAGPPEPDAEVAELCWQHGLAPAEVGAVLGWAARVPAEAGRPLPVAAPVPAPPGWLREELVAALGVEAGGRRAELARRAHPYDPEGFPVPVDHHRLSARALAWSAAAVVLTALALLITVPAGGPTGTSPGPALAAEMPGPAAAASFPAAALPTLVATGFAEAPQTSSRASRPTPDRGVPGQAAPATTPAGTPTARAGTAGAGRPAAGLVMSWRPAGDCGSTWTADLRVRVYGREESAVTRVTATAAGGGSVALSRTGWGWAGTLTGLPSGRTATVTVTAGAADGSTVRSVSQELTHTC